MKNLLTKTLLLGVFLVSTQVFAWGLTGHRVVAEIAEHHLTHRAKKNLNKIFEGQSIAYWANWPDFIKSDTTGVWKPTSVWHFVNIDPQPDFASFKKAIEAQKGPTLYTQIEILKNQIKNKNTSAKDRRIALIFLVHLVGDLHQPLHAGREGDLGGNRIKVTYFGQPTNLHSVWDSKLIDSQKYSYTEYARLLDVKSKAENKQIQSGTVLDWLYESHEAANDIYAHTPEGSKLGYGYGYRYDDLMESQLLKGGLRLAKVLNDLF